MKHPEKVLRDFNKPDEEMLQQSTVQQALFVENKKKFTERFPQLNDPFADEWNAAIVAARNMLPDYASLANQTTQTTGIEALMEQARMSYQTLMLYTQLAFPGDTAVLQLMGQSQYNTSRNSQTKLPTLLHTAYMQASKPDCLAALRAKGMQETDIDALESLAQSIVNLNFLQEKSKTDRSIDTNQRIKAMNAVWNKMALVCQGAKLVFQHDATL